MNINIYNTFLIKAKLLAKNEIIYKHFANNNYKYFQNLKDFLNYYIDNNSCNITNNNLLNNFMNSINNWHTSTINIKTIIYQDFSHLVYNYDISDNEMYDLLLKLNVKIFLVFFFFFLSIFKVVFLSESKLIL
jgi:hypothetical protein